MDRKSYIDSCTRIERHFLKVSGEDADADYALHELAHFIVLFRRLPRRRKDWWLITATIDKMPLGKTPFHEMRTVALQHVGLSALGQRPSLERLVRISWPGVENASYLWSLGGGAGKRVMRSRAQMMAITKRLIGEVSNRNLKLFVNEVKKWLKSEEFIE